MRVRFPRSIGVDMEYDVAVEIKIFVQENSKIKQVKEGISKLVKVQDCKEDEVGFGIKALKATILLNDKEGGLDMIEEKIRAIDGVSEMEVENITRF